MDAMWRRVLPPLCVGVWLLPPATPAALADGPLPPAAQAEFFEKSVRPILATHCLECHGPEKPKADLRLDSRTAMMTGGASGPAVVPGKPADSLLIQAVQYTGQPRMPPNGKLKPAQIAALPAWVTP